MWQLYTVLLYKSFHTYLFSSKECCSFAKSCLTLCYPMARNTPGSSVLHYLLEFTQIREKKTSCWCSYTSLVTMTLFSHIIVNLLFPIPYFCVFFLFFSVVIFSHWFLRALYPVRTVKFCHLCTVFSPSFSFFLSMLIIFFFFGSEIVCFICFRLIPFPV